MLFYEGQRIRSLRTFDLDGCLVDGNIVYAEDYEPGDVPCVNYNQEFEILSMSGGFALLRNLDDYGFWGTCEIDESDLQDFELCY